MENIQKRVHILEAYAVISLLAFGVLAFSAFTQTRQKIDELTVERLNIVEKDGQLVAVMANTDRMPDPIVGGKSFKTERPPGMALPRGKTRAQATNTVLMEGSPSISTSNRKPSVLSTTTTRGPAKSG